MKVKLKSNPEKIYVVYGVYWATSKGKYQRHHFVIEPEDAVGGFSPLLEEEVDIFDPSLDFYFMSKDNDNMDMLVHEAAHPSSNFFDDLIDCGELEKVEIVFQNMRELGLEP